MSQIPAEGPLIAIRMDRLDSSAGKGPWEMVYSTTQSETLREQLEALLKGLEEYLLESKRGDSLKIPSGVGQVGHLPMKLSTVWIVFDCGFIE